MYRISSTAKRVATVTAAAAVVGLALTACSTSASSSSSSSNAVVSASTASAVNARLAVLEKYPTKITVSKELSKEPSAGKKVAFLSNGIPAAQRFGNGVKAATQTLGWTYSLLSISQADPTSTNSAMLSAVNAGADYIVVVTTPVAEFAQALSVARAHGATVIDLGTDDASQAGMVAVAQSTAPAGSQVLEGKAISDVIVSNVAKTKVAANVLDVTVPLLASIFEPTDKALKAQLASDCAKCAYAEFGQSSADFLSGNGMPAIVSYLQSHPAVNYLNFTGPAPVGWSTALASAGFGKLTVTMVDGSAADQKLLTQGKALADVATSTTLGGWFAIDAAARNSVGDSTSAAATMNLAPIWVARSTSKFTPSDDLGAPKNYDKQYAALWKK